jgi:hypothetical protein
MIRRALTLVSNEAITKDGARLLDQKRCAGRIAGSCSHVRAAGLLGWLVADGWCWFVLREEYCWLVVRGWFVLREKYCWLVADKPNEQADLMSW